VIEKVSLKEIPAKRHLEIPITAARGAFLTTLSPWLGCEGLEGLKKLGLQPHPRYFSGFSRNAIRRFPSWAGFPGCCYKTTSFGRAHSPVWLLSNSPLQLTSGLPCFQLPSIHTSRPIEVTRMGNRSFAVTRALDSRPFSQVTSVGDIRRPLVASFPIHSKLS